MRKINRDLIKQILEHHKVDVSCMNDIILICNHIDSKYKIDKSKNSITIFGGGEVKINESVSYIESDWNYDILDSFNDHDEYLLLITMFPFNEIDKQFIILDKLNQIK